MNIGFVGFGKLGKPCAEEMAKHHDVIVYDTHKVYSNVCKVATTLEEITETSEIVFVAVPTPHESEYDGSTPSSHLPPKDFSYEIVEEVITELNSDMTKDQLLVLISTVLPGTVREKIAPLVTNTSFVYNPYLIAMGSVAHDLVNPEMIMIGTEDGSETGDAKLLTDFYRTFVNEDCRYVIGTWDECECIKVFYNTFISTKLSLVNMIQDVAQRQGNINVDVVTKALADSDKRIMGKGYMRSGMGDGGACHPRDNIALRFMAEKLNLGYDIFQTIMESREAQAKNIAEEVLKYGKKIMFTSDSYKSGVDITQGSYSLLVQHYIKELGGEVVEDYPDVLFKVHEDDDIELDLAYAIVEKDVIIFDPWRTHKSKNPTIWYGSTR